MWCWRYEIFSHTHFCLLTRKGLLMALWNLRSLSICLWQLKYRGRFQPPANFSNCVVMKWEWSFMIYLKQGKGSFIFADIILKLHWSPLPDFSLELCLAPAVKLSVFHQKKKLRGACTGVQVRRGELSVSVPATADTRALSHYRCSDVCSERCFRLDYFVLCSCSWYF